MIRIPLCVIMYLDQSCGHSRDSIVKPDFIHPNGKHIYTVWIVPYPLYSALCAIHSVENSIMWDALDSRDHLITQKI